MSQRFLEVTPFDGDPVLINLDHIVMIKKDDSGFAVLYLSNHAPRVLPFRCKESYEVVVAAMGRA